MKNYVLILIAIVLFSCKTVSSNNTSDFQNNANHPLDRILMDSSSINQSFYIETNIVVDNKNVFITKILEMGEFTLRGQKVGIIVFETDPNINFIKILSDNHFLGIEAEYAWINYRYPGFRRTEQRLVEIIIDGSPLPFDILKIENAQTREVLFIYFEISDFFGNF